MSSARALRSESLEMSLEVRFMQEGPSRFMRLRSLVQTVNVKHAFWEEGAKALKARLDSGQTGLKRLGVSGKRG